jgi:cytochrome c556
MKKITITTLLALLVVLVACNQAEESPVAESNPEKPRMYEPSELASLMRSMYEDNMELKKAIEEGYIPESFPEDFYKIHTANATNPGDINETYKALADKYLQDMERVIQSDEASVRRNFNEMVNTCISCHQIFCQGPIPKIKKLAIQEI